MNSINSSQSLIQKITHLLDQATSTCSHEKASSSFYHETIQERYLTCCSCLLLSLQETQQQEQLLEERDNKERNLLSESSACREIIRSVLIKYPMLKSFIHDLTQVEIIIDDNTDPNVNGTTLYECYERMGVQLLWFYYSLNDNYSMIMEKDKRNEKKKMMIDEQNIQSNVESMWDKYEWQQDFIRIHKSLSKFSDKTVDSSISVLDVELVQLMSLLFNNFNYFMTRDMITNNCSNEEQSVLDDEMNGWIKENKERIYELPRMIFEFYYCKYCNYQMQKESNSKTTIPNIAVTSQSDHGNLSDDDDNEVRIMIQIMSSIFERNTIMDVSSDTEVSSTDMQYLYQLELVFVQFTNHYLQFVSLISSTKSTTKASQSGTDISVLSRSALLNMIKRVTSRSNVDSNESRTSTVNLLLNISILSLIDADITNELQSNEHTKSTWNIVQSLLPRKKSFYSLEKDSKSPSIDIEVATSIQKLMLFNLSSTLDYSTIHSMNDRNDQLNVMKIRTMTLGSLSKLLERCGIEWISTENNDRWSDVVPSSSELGERSGICTILRFVAGELRLSMGTFLDVRYQEGDTSVIELNDIFLEKLTHCIEIGSNILLILMEMREDFTISIDSNLKFTPDAILHFKHSLDDMLDSNIQFLLQDNFSQDCTWRKGAYQCCRFLGCYLADVDIFQYDDSTDSIDHHEESSSVSPGEDATSSYPHDMNKTKISCNHLFLALRNGLHLLHELYTGAIISKPYDKESSDNFSVVTLFPCVSTILSSCFYDSNITKRQVDMAKKYLLSDSDKDDILVNFLCSVMVKTLESFRDREYDNGFHDRDNNDFLCISWCNKVIRSLFLFMIRATVIQASSSNDKNAVHFFTSNDSKRVETLFSSMYLWIEHLIDLYQDEVVLEIGASMTQNLLLVSDFVNKPMLEKMQKGIDLLDVPDKM